MVNSPLIRPYLLGGGSFGGGTLDSHEVGPHDCWLHLSLTFCTIDTSTNYKSMGFFTEILVCQRLAFKGPLT